MVAIRFLKLYGERYAPAMRLLACLQNHTSLQLLAGVQPSWLAVGPLKKVDWISDWWFEQTRKENLGWIHSLPDHELINGFPAANQLAIMSISQHPYLWLLAMHEYENGEKHRPMSFSQFVRTPWQTVGREMMEEAVLPSPIELWNAKNQAYLLLSDLPVPHVHIRYEDLAAAPDEHLSQQLNILGIDYAPFRAGTPTPDIAQAYQSDHQYHQLMQWQKEINSTDRSWIDQHLNHRIVQSLGYELN